MLYHFLSAKSDHSVFFLLLGTNLAWKNSLFFMDTVSLTQFSVPWALYPQKMKFSL